MQPLTFGMFWKLLDLNKKVESFESDSLTNMALCLLSFYLYTYLKCCVLITLSRHNYKCYVVILCSHRLCNMQIFPTDIFGPHRMIYNAAP